MVQKLNLEFVCGKQLALLKKRVKNRITRFGCYECKMELN